MTNTHTTTNGSATTADVTNPITNPITNASQLAAAFSALPAGRRNAILDWLINTDSDCAYAEACNFVAEQHGVAGDSPDYTDIRMCYLAENLFLRMLDTDIYSLTGAQRNNLVTFHGAVTDGDYTNWLTAGRYIWAEGPNHAPFGLYLACMLNTSSDLELPWRG